MTHAPVNQADLIIRARWIVPVEPAGTSLRDHALVIGDGRILALLPQAEATRRFRTGSVVDRPQHVLLPGLVNAHTRSATCLMRGLGAGLPPLERQQRHVGPAEARWVAPGFIRDGTRLAMLEMLRSGTTCFGDSYYFPDAVAALAVEHQMRASVGMLVSERPTPWAQGTDECFARGLAIHDQYRGHALLRTHFAPDTANALGDATLRHLRLLADELDVPVHMPLHTTAEEVRQGIALHGLRPLERVAELGLLTAGLSAVRATEISAEDSARLAASSASVVHCPTITLLQAAGLTPLASLARAGVRIALASGGTDAGNRPDLFDEMRLASLLAGGLSGDATALPAPAALAMATLGGAQALGLGEQLGSLVPGKLADLICIDPGSSGMAADGWTLAQLLHGDIAKQVSDSWIGGRQVLEDGRALFFDEAAVLAAAQAWQQRLGSP